MAETEEEITMRITLKGKTRPWTNSVVHNLYDEYCPETKRHQWLGNYLLYRTAVVNLFLEGLFTEKRYSPELIGENMRQFMNTF
jgi:hypothetical protein